MTTNWDNSWYVTYLVYVKGIDGNTFEHNLVHVLQLLYKVDIVKL